MAGQSGGNRKWGRNDAKCKAYKTSHRLEQHKVKRVLQSSGIEAARIYADKKNITSYLNNLLEKRN
jgi:hypothetical protein